MRYGKHDSEANGMFGLFFFKYLAWQLSDSVGVGRWLIVCKILVIG